MSRVIFTPGPTPIIMRYGPTSAIIQDVVEAPPVDGPGTPNNYWMRWNGTLLQNFIGWNTAVADSQDDDDATYGTYTGGNQSQGVYAEIAACVDTPPNNTSGKIWIRARRPAGAGTNKIGIVVYNNAQAQFAELNDNIDIAMTTSWAWYSYALTGVGNTGGTYSFDTSDMDLAVRNGDEGSPGSPSSNSLEISEMVVVAYS